jgi:hypothetical protein
VCIGKQGSRRINNSVADAARAIVEHLFATFGHGPDLHSTRIATAKLSVDRDRPGGKRESPR